MAVRPKRIADNLNKIVKNYWNRVALDGKTWRNRMQTPKFKIISASEANSIQKASHVNFRCMYFHLKMAVRPKHVADNLNKIVNNYWNRAALDGNPLNWSIMNPRILWKGRKFDYCYCHYFVSIDKLYVYAFQRNEWQTKNKSYPCLIYEYL
jgi:hypothetical protein